MSRFQTVNSESSSDENSPRNTVKQIKPISKTARLKDQAFGVQMLQEHLLYVLRQSVEEVLFDALPVEKVMRSSARISAKDFAVYSTRMYEDDDPKAFLAHLEQYKAEPLSKLVYLAMLNPNTMDYKCALVLLQISLINYAHGSGCVNACGRVMRFTARDDIPRTNPDIRHSEELQLRKVCDDFFASIVDEVNKHAKGLESIKVDIRTIDQLVRKATFNLCKLLPYDYMKFVPTIFYQGQYHPIETGPRGGKFITPSKGKKVYI